MKHQRVLSAVFTKRVLFLTFVYDQAVFLSGFLSIWVFCNVTMNN